MNNFYLKYLNDDGSVITELDQGVDKLKDIDGFNSKEFYEHLDNVIKGLDDEKGTKIIEQLPGIKPFYLFGVLYYLLKDWVKEPALEKDFEYLKQYIDYEVAIFMIVNFMRTK